VVLKLWGCSTSIRVSRLRFIAIILSIVHPGELST
jgi:hypothetical protein